LFEGILQSFTIPEVRKRILFTLGAFAIFRLGAYIPIPGLNADLVRAFDTGGGILDFVNLFTGNAFETFSVFALGVIPYINASIIMSLLQNVVPFLKELQKQGEDGKKEIQKYIRYGTVGLAILQAAGVAVFISTQGFVLSSVPLPFFFITAIVGFTAGTMFLMWLGERITENGIGRGVSMIIMGGIIASFPGVFGNLFNSVSSGQVSFFWVLMIPVMFIAVVAGVVMVQLGARRVEIQYAKRVVRGKVYGGQNTYIPFGVNQGGVIPIIFAAAILTFLQIPLEIESVREFFGQVGILNSIIVSLQNFGLAYLVIYASMIFFFTYFYSSIVFNPQDLSDNLRNWGGYIPGIRPGKPTSDYLERIQTRLLTIGGSFLVVIALMPYIVQSLSGMQTFFALGGTSILIAVGVGVDTVKQIEAHMVERHYESLIRRGAAVGRQ